MKHIKFEENILVDDSYNASGKDVNADDKKKKGIAKHFAENLEYEETKKWYHEIPAEPPITKTLGDDKIAELKKEASSALHGDTLAYENKSSKNTKSDHQWARTLMNKGAIGDRVAAATILIQDNPLYNLSAVRNLIGLVKPAKKKDGLKVIDALSELMVADLLVPNLKLTKFEQHALGHLDELTSGNKDARKKLLKLWYFEDQLKELYGTYIEALNKFAHDSVDSNREKAVSSMSYLLMHHPEKEKMLLMNVINKLGDPSQSVASKVIYHLCQMLYNHPNMKPIVLAEIEKMLFRANISKRAQYYGICFLNQFFLGKDDSKVAEQLISIYFSFFKACIKTGSIDSRLMSAILTGVKRAWPFAASDGQTDASVHIAAVHKLVHLAQLNVAVHALALLAQMSGGEDDRYYTALYRKLQDPSIFETSHTAMLFSLIYKSLRRDSNMDRVCAFVKRLLQICAMLRPAQACGVLFMISQVMKDKKKSEAMRLSWEAVKEELKEESEIHNISDTVASDEPVSSVCKETGLDESKKPKPKFDLLKGDKIDLLAEENDEERYDDLKIDSKGNIRPKKRPKRGETSAAGWFHVRIKAETSTPAAEVDTGKAREKVGDKELDSKIKLKRAMNSNKVITSFDPNARNPAYAGAQCSVFTELYLLARHFHPTVQLFARKLITNQIISYSGDPLIDFSGSRFLDRFVFKNPKKIDKTDRNEDGGVKRIKGSHPKFAVRDNYTAKGIRSVPVTSSTYIHEDPTKIPVDEKFLYDFLQRRRVVKETSDDENDDSDADSVTSEDFNKYLDQVTGTKPEDVSDEEIDFLGDVVATATSAKKVKRSQDDDEEIAMSSGDDDDIDQDGSDDGELNISGDEDGSEDEDERLLEDSEDEDFAGPKSKKVKKGKGDLNSLFASAEEFSSLLEESAQNKHQGSSQAVATTDNANVKQLAWEENRNRWVKGFNRKVLGGNSKPGTKKRKFDNKKGGKFENRKRGGGHLDKVKKNKKK